MVQHTPAATPARAQRAVRLLPAVGSVMAIGFALLYALWPAATGPTASRVISIACAALALIYALLALAAPRIGLRSMAAATVLGALVVAGLVAAISGEALLLPALAFVPLLLAAAAPVISRRTTLALAAVHAALLALLGLAVLYGHIPARHGVAGLAAALAQQVGLLISGTVIGLLTQRGIERSMRRAHSREQRFVGLLAVAADWYWETDAELRYTHIAQPPAPCRSRRCSGGWARRHGRSATSAWTTKRMDAHRSDLEARRPFTDLRVQQRDRAGWLAAFRCRAGRAWMSAASSSATGAWAATSPSSSAPRPSAAPPSCATASCSRARPRRWYCIATVASSMPTSPRWRSSGPGSRRT